MTISENSSSEETSTIPNSNSQSASGEKTESAEPGMSSEGSQFLKEVQRDLPGMVQDLLNQCLDDMERNALAALTRLWIDSIASVDAMTILAGEILKSPELEKLPALKQELEKLTKLTKPVNVALKNSLARVLLRPDTDGPTAPPEEEKDPHEVGGIGAT